MTAAAGRGARRRSTGAGGSGEPGRRGTGGDALATYRAMRDPARTPEPVPDGRAGGRSREGHPKGRGRGAPRTAEPGAPTFVVQEHHATSLHWDLRLERDGVLASWAVPKGLPLDPGHDHLAVRTEDHPLEYGSFEGTIPAGEYGGGTVAVWDRGTYDCEKWDDREVKFVLRGRRLTGRYVLFRTDGRRWMVHRMDPAPAGWEALPDDLLPMLCALGPLPADDTGWAYELKWDGVRVVASVEGGRVRLRSRNDLDVTGTYPELAGLGEALGARPAVLDGEVVATDDQGRPRFGLLQRRMRVTDRHQARRLAARVPVTYLVFDVLHLDGHATLDRTYDERRRLLASLALDGDHWATPPAFVDRSGADVLRASLELGLEGVVAKRRESRYTPGRRSPDWVKVKHVRTQEVVVGGWSRGKGRRAASIGALLVGVPGEGGLVYAGKVGTGFTDDALGELRVRLQRSVRKTSPFADDVPEARSGDVTWVSPTMVGEVGFAEWTHDGRLRHPTWRGLRPDKSPSDVTYEA